MFLSCRPFVVITTLSTGLVGVEVTSVSWLGQLTIYCITLATDSVTIHRTKKSNELSYNFTRSFVGCLEAHMLRMGRGGGDNSFANTASILKCISWTYLQLERHIYLKQSYKAGASRCYESHFVRLIDPKLAT